MFSFFKRKKEEKRKRGRQKEREAGGVAAQRDGKFATAQPVQNKPSVVGKESAGLQRGQQPSGSMGNDISKPVSALQGLSDISFLDVASVPAVLAGSGQCDQLVASKCVSSDHEPKEAGSSETFSGDKNTVPVEINTNIEDSSELASPFLVKRINELEKIARVEACDLNIPAKNDLDSENYVICDGPPVANETKDEYSVRDNVGPDDSNLAKLGSVASSEEYSTGDGESSREVSKTLEAASSDAQVQPGENMYKLNPYAQSFEPSSVLSYKEVYDGLKCNSEGNIYGLKTGSQAVRKSGDADSRKTENNEETDESSEEESSESEQSESDNIVKNDSGCWEERESSLYLNETESQVSDITSSRSASDIAEGKSKEKKHVRWADIDGQRKLTHEKEGSVVSSEGSSEEEETEEEDADKSEEEEDEEEDSEEDEGEETTGENQIESSILTNVKLSVNKSEDKEEESESSEEESEEEKIEECNKHLNEIGEGKDKGEAEAGSKESSDESSESDDESREEESCNRNELKEEEKTSLTIDIAEMQNRIADLQRDLSLKASNIDRLQVELDAACNESEMVRKRFKRLESDLDSYKQTNQELTERINETATKEVEIAMRKGKQLDEAEKKIKSLEQDLANVKAELISLQASYKKLETDRDMEVQIIQKALEKALADQEEMEAKYEREFENLRTLNSSREVQMLEDFEWKLREVQKSCKKKMQDLEVESEKKCTELVNKLAAAQVDLEQISHLKLCEIELNQLKQTSSEQRKNLRLTNRKLEELQVSEKILQEEVNSLRASLDKEKNHVATLQALHREELIDRDKKAKLKLEAQISQLSLEWEERLRRETFKLKTETERTLREENTKALEATKKLKDLEITQLKQSWEKKVQDLKKEIENYKRKINEMEDSHKLDFDNVQTNADRDILELRRKMDKLDMSYQEKIEKIQEQNEKDLSVLKEECERKVQQSEANLQLQVGNSRATIELVKQQMQNQAQLKLEQLEQEYQKKLDQQWERLSNEKQWALEKLEQDHKQNLELLYLEIEKIKKQSSAESENQGKKKNLPTNQSQRISSSGQKRNDVTNFRNLTSTRLDVAEVAEEIRTQGKEEVLQKSIEQLTKQLNAGKMEIEKLRQQLEARENSRQQRNNPQPVPNPRRNRKPRSGRN